MNTDELLERARRSFPPVGESSEVEDEAIRRALRHWSPTARTHFIDTVTDAAVKAIDATDTPTREAMIRYYVKRAIRAKYAEHGELPEWPS